MLQQGMQRFRPELGTAPGPTQICVAELVAACAIPSLSVAQGVVQSVPQGAANPYGGGYTKTPAGSGPSGQPQDDWRHSGCTAGPAISQHLAMQGVPSMTAGRCMRLSQQALNCAGHTGHRALGSTLRDLLRLGAHLYFDGTKSAGLHLMHGRPAGMWMMSLQCCWGRCTQCGSTS